MNKTFRLYTCLLTAILLSTFFNSYGQSDWQWGKRGGSFAGSNSGAEEVVSVEMDPSGNVYVLARNASGAVPQVDGHLGIGIYDQITLASWNCNGGFRWMKNFGSAASVITCGMKVDSSGGIYIAGNMQSHNATRFGYFDTDTVLGNQGKSMYVVKYDSSGNLQWLKRPQPPTFDVTSGTNGIFGFVGFDVSARGDVYLMGYFSPGSYEGNAFNVPNKGYYVLKYNSGGAFQQLSPLQMTTTNGGFSYNIDGQSNVFTAKFARDHKRNRSILYGQYDKSRGNLTIGNLNISGTGGIMGYPIFLASFDNSGNNTWTKQSSADGYTIGRQCVPAVDEQGNVYIGGDASPQAGNSFNGHTFINTELSYMPVPFVISVDTSGANRWVSAGNPNNAVLGSAIVYRNSKVWLLGAYTDKLKWTNINLDTDAGITGGYRPFLASFSAVNGTILSMDTLVATDIANETTALGTDRNNNIYVGGKFGEQLFVANDTLNSVGGDYDWFVAKFGSANCNCILPAPGYSFNTTGVNTLNFTYTGSTPYMSISWDFGDSSPASATANPTHVYSAAGNYTVCVTVTNACGSNTYCAPVNTSGNGTGIIPGFAKINVYPNPATQQIHIDHAAAGTLLEVFSVTGKRMIQLTLNGNTDAFEVAHLASGVYLLRFTDKDGKQGSTRIAKQ